MQGHRELCFLPWLCILGLAHLELESLFTPTTVPVLFRACSSVVEQPRRARNSLRLCVWGTRVCEVGNWPPCAVAFLRLGRTFQVFLGLFTCLFLHTAMAAALGSDSDLEALLAGVDRSKSSITRSTAFCVGNPDRWDAIFAAILRRMAQVAADDALTMLYLVDSVCKSAPAFAKQTVQPGLPTLLGLCGGAGR